MGYTWTSRDQQVSELTEWPREIQPSERGGVAGYVWPSDGSQHILYIDVSGHVQELWSLKNSPHNWTRNDLMNATSAPRAPEVDTRPHGYVWEGDSDGSSQHAVYVSEDLHVRELWNRPGGWHPSDLTGVAGAPLARAGTTPFGYVWERDPNSSSQHVVYVDGGGRVQDLWFRNNARSWHCNDLITATSDPWRASYTPLVNSRSVGCYVWDSDPSGSSQHVVYVGADSDVHELWFNAGQRAWHHNNLSSAASAPDALAGATPYGYAWESDPGGSSQHVLYQGVDAHVHELWFSANDRRWHHNDLTKATGAPPTSGTAFGYACDNDPQGVGQHVAYHASHGVTSDSTIVHTHHMYFNGKERVWHDEDLDATIDEMGPVAGPYAYAWEQAGSQHILYSSADVSHYSYPS
jgi:hypothetical protein